jgi:DNA polymerase-3 subunit delta'
LKKKLQVSVNKIHDWNIPVWQGLLERIDSLSHGLLFAGPAGVGKVHFAEQFSAWLLCESSSKGSARGGCGVCPSCQLLASGNHPDIRVLTLDEEEEDEEGETKSSKTKKPSTQIKIDQVRALEDFVNVGSHRSGARVVLIHPAEAMNLAAANSLLKMLADLAESLPQGGVRSARCGHGHGLAQGRRREESGEAAAARRRRAAGGGGMGGGGAGCAVRSCG